jgi:CHAT domain-containing protein
MVPFSALASPTGHWLGELSEFTVLPPWWSIHPASALGREQIGSDAHFLALEGFDRDRADSSEARDIASLFFSGDVIGGQSASTGEILNAISSADVFHFSGHATSTSGARLLLSSAATGTTETLSPDSLRNVRLPRCRLAVLAACNTTAADPDQIEKLPDMRNALLVSGAQAAVASNWDVDDRSTNALMLGFYHQLLRGAPAAEALRIAEQSVRSSPLWQHPFYWAAFELFTR